MPKAEFKKRPVEMPLAIRQFDNAESHVSTLAPSPAELGHSHCAVREDARGEAGLPSAERLYLADIVNSSNDAIITRTNDGLVASWNKAAERMYGYCAEEVVGMPVANLAPALKAHDSYEIAARVERGETISQYETTRRRRDGSEFHVSISAFPIRNAAGEIIGTSAIVQDITERKIAQERLRTLEAELAHLSRWNTMGTMASTLAHELNQPLAAITNYLGAVKRILAKPDGESADGTVKYLESAMTEARIAADVIRSVRRFIDKREAGRSIENINSVVEEAISLSHIGTIGLKLQTSIHLAPDLPPVLIDKVQILQVLLNLTRNAMDALSGTNRPVLSIETKIDPAGLVRVSVSDNGPGLDPTVAGRLFQPFVTTKQDGMGVGLTICKSILESHGGDIRATAISPSGLCLSFHLPIADTLNA
jgi:two-component system sensor kinase FixL